ncbi:hypothetical protein TVAG_234360 [Trichomonas vaginalis G3]|uniref:Uncharacterized protein n=1 Tax=Trichomonas vaginalis (strain ATCC PRA-98 / G3) TaxID=412133 RepID=A2FPP2_TRIV3|nr:hypothetical protein TVAGG3_0774650 [Trichomonas vaginalis G3]EAX93118.1 hypothetical protein TVAG_234360 [Trichomonas vaginalis G3]KAI5514079.1 hypothetical protein TVAGG3_0774650 [Trichomonas vaginalis G3]|eukprot:XP_001306048.1 hypothetical protein [Trichomonas vaginalis G3]
MSYQPAPPQEDDYTTTPIKSPRKKHMNSRVPPPRISPELELLKQKAINGEDISNCDSSLFPDLIVALKQQRDFLISYDLYDDSEECDKALKEVMKLNDAIMKQSSQKKAVVEYKARLSKAKKELIELQHRANKLEKELEKDLEEQDKQLEEKQKKEIEEYEEKWNSEGQLRRYNRASGTLRNMKTQAIHLLNSHRYEEMRIVEQQANSLAESEAIRSHQNMEADYSNGYLLLEKKHEAERAQLKEAQERRRKVFESAKEIDEDVLKARIKKLETALEDASNSNRTYYMNVKTARANGTILAVQPAGMGKKRVDVTKFNTLKLPALNHMPEMLRRTRSPTTPRSARNPPRGMSYDKFNFSELNSPSPNGRPSPMSPRYQRSNQHRSNSVHYY